MGILIFMFGAAAGYAFSEWLWESHIANFIKKQKGKSGVNIIKNLEELLKGEYKK